MRRVIISFIVGFALGLVVEYRIMRHYTTALNECSASYNEIVDSLLSSSDRVAVAGSSLSALVMERLDRPMRKGSYVSPPKKWVREDGYVEVVGNEPDTLFEEAVVLDTSGEVSRVFDEGRWWRWSESGFWVAE